MVQKPPLLSIIIACKNAAATLGASLQSVVSQAFDAAELIVVAADSTDGSDLILQQYQAHIAVLLRGANAGVYDAYNRGVAAASGEWVYILGSDDVLLADVWQKIFEQPPAASVQAIYGNVLLKKTLRPYAGIFSTEKLLMQNICQQAVIYRRSILGNPAFSLRYPLWSDYHFHLLHFNADTWHYTDTDIAIYDNTQGSTARAIDEVFIDDFPKLLRGILSNTAPQNALYRRACYTKQLRRLRHELRRGSYRRALQQWWQMAWFYPEKIPALTRFFLSKSYHRFVQ